jgi:hypothetical protein
MFELITDAFHTIYNYVVSCFRRDTFDYEYEYEYEYGHLPDCEPVTEISKKNIQIPKYQFILLQDN